jgi:RNA polymerase sigma-70 factor, ECF subfamily
MGRYGPMVLSLAYASTLSWMDAEDLAQETFLVAWLGLARFRGDAAFSTWLYGLARSRCTDRARRAGARPKLAQHTDTDAIQVASGDPAGRKTALAILSAAGRLPMPQRQAVLMRDVQGLSYDEIAALQDVPVGTVRSRIAAARSRLADEVGES